MGIREFRWRLAGLSDTSRLRTTLARDNPGGSRIDDPHAAQQLLESI